MVHTRQGLELVSPHGEMLKEVWSTDSGRGAGEPSASGREAKADVALVL